MTIVGVGIRGSSRTQRSDNVCVIFNHIHDVQTGVSIEQQVHCERGEDTAECCCPGCCGLAGFGDRCCEAETSCCSLPFSEYEGPNYGTSRMYVVGNIFNHIQPFGASDVTEKGQAVQVGHNADVHVANNTLSKCSQGVHIPCTHNTGTCPPTGDMTHGEQGKRRNTSVAVVNNVMLDAVDPGYYADVHVCSGPPIITEFTLTSGELGFGHNLHYGANRAFRLPNGQNYFSVEALQGLPYGYGEGSEGDDVGPAPMPDDHPRLVNPANLQFDLTVDSPTFMFTGGVWDAAYDAFEAQNWGFTVPGGIRHDYDGHVYGTTPAIGAFGD